MDSIYSQFLSFSPPSLRERLHRVLSAVVVLEHPTMATLSDLLELDSSDILPTLQNLGLIVEIEELPTLPPTLAEFPLATYISPIVSFQDVAWKEFFTDQSRAKDFWIDYEAARKTLQNRADHLLSTSISPSPIAMHRSTWKTIFHGLSGLWPENEDYERSWDDSWPLFALELKNFQHADLAHQRLVTSNPQSIMTFCLLLRCCKEGTDDEYLSEEGVNFKTAQSVVAAALREWFEDQSPNSTGMFDILPYLFRSETSMWTETVQEMSNQPHLSWDIVLGIIDRSRGFVNLDTGNVYAFHDPTSHPLRVCVDWSLMDVIENSNLVGSEFFKAYREVRIRALRDTYEAFLNEEDLTLLKHKAWDLFLKPMRDSYILILNPDIDDPPSCSLSILIDRIHSPQSLSVLLGPNLAYLGCHTLFTPLMSFVILNCQKASMLGPSFKNLHQKLKDLLVIFLQNGALTAAFADPDTHDALQRRHNITIYRTISNLEGFDRGQWLDLIDNTAHTTILEFFLGEDLVRCFYGWKPSTAAVEWARHFAEATYSSKIIECLLALHARLHDHTTGSKIIIKYKPLLSPGSFTDGLGAWKEKYVEQNSTAAVVLNNLRVQLSSIDWSDVIEYEDESDESDDEEDTDANSGEDDEESDDEES
ncbi:hypothetical protein CPB83DRAFT_854717 [Crepidotus variabilis]|uniref:Uncharacterized protein n=1 Tax=Crepidotus variabilis TaxID=179855 RepID=A0A9P6JPX2_9AGAR|nr:hypothetical protein CPB83DRAFT_854717 [Crepidotus variabilis]